MNELIVSPTGFGLTAILAALVGGSLLAIVPDWVRRHRAVFLLFAAGLLLAFTLIELLPQAFGQTTQAGLFVLAGFGLGLLLSALSHSHGDDAAIGVSGRTGIAVGGISFHAFLDGAVFAIATGAHPENGAVAALALGLHKLPEAALTFGIIRAGGAKVGVAMLVCLAVVGLVTSAGIALAQPILSLAGEGGIGALLAISAGLILFIATGPLMMAASQTSSAKAMIAVGAGAGVALVLLLLAPHSHHIDHDDHDHHDHRRLDFRDQASTRPVMESPSTTVS